MSNLYQEYKISDEWRIIEKAINELIDNQDIEVITLKDYVIGYISKQLIDNKGK